MGRVLDYIDQRTVLGVKAHWILPSLSTAVQDWRVLDLIANERGKLVPQTQLAMFFGEEEDPIHAAAEAVQRINDLLRSFGVEVISELTYAIVPQTHRSKQVSSSPTQSQD